MDIITHFIEKAIRKNCVLSIGQSLEDLYQHRRTKQEVISYIRRELSPIPKTVVNQKNKPKKLTRYMRRQFVAGDTLIISHKDNPNKKFKGVVNSHKVNKTPVSCWHFSNGKSAGQFTLNDDYIIYEWIGYNGYY